MKKYFFRLFLFILIIFNIIIIYNYYKKIFSNEQIIIKSKSEEIINNELLSYLYETQIDSGIYQTVSDSNWDLTNYRFNSNLSKCQNGSKLSYNEITKQVTLQGNKADKCYLYFDQVSLIKFSDYIKSLYTSDGANGIYFHDGVGTYTNADLEAGDNSYRFSGANPHNYVCFGTDEMVCPAENIYRIIGVFNNNGVEQVKLIKWDYATEDMLGKETQAYPVTNPDIRFYKGALTNIPTYYWCGSSSTAMTNIWSESTLNTIALNTNYLDYLDKNNSKWRSMIATTTWQQSGLPATNGYNESTAKLAYDYELGANKINEAFEIDCDGSRAGTAMCTYSATINAKIGLIYLSEYYYSASPTYWSYKGTDSSCSYISSSCETDYRTAVFSNWMYMGRSDLAISRNSTSVVDYLNISMYGFIGNSNVWNYGAIRPTFNLENEVVFISGDGSSLISPYRISI
ncbi:MAG: hypothetical protein E7172_00865 [Firmicutes bacterium]|nr:hypothetical protein [Bacillota bacterium]